MPSTTLLESAKLSQNKFLSGIIETTVTTNQFFQVLPFMGIDGNALQYTRENVLADVQTAGVGDTITANAAATWTSVTTSLTTIVGDASVNGLIQATRSNYMNQAESQIISKTKALGRKYQDMLVNGSIAGDATQFDGLLTLLPAGQTIASTGANGDVLSFEVLDALISLVKDKDGQVDYFMMNDREIRAYLKLCRSLSGVGINEAISLPGGGSIQGYRGVPIFRNDWMPVNQTRGTAINASTILAGTLDDGSNKVGISGLHASNDMGVNVKYIGESQTKDESIYRTTWYTGLCLFSNLGIAGATGIIP